jgi:hypothetical protein
MKPNFKLCNHYGMSMCDHAWFKWVKFNWLFLSCVVFMLVGNFIGYVALKKHLKHQEDLTPGVPKQYLQQPQ